MILEKKAVSLAEAKSFIKNMEERKVLEEYFG